jgi:hypothetical protein
MKLKGTISMPGEIEVPIITREVKVDGKPIKNAKDPDSAAERAFIHAVMKEFKIEVWYME